MHMPCSRTLLLGPNLRSVRHPLTQSRHQSSCIPSLTRERRPAVRVPRHSSTSQIDRVVSVRSLASISVETNALQVTDPLLIYRAKVARGELEEDEEQLRALVELRRINRVLRDYIPPAHLLGILNEDTQSNASASLSNSVASRLRPGSREIDDEGEPTYSGKQKIGDLVRWLSDSEGLSQLGTPKGLLLTGTPGTGKSMVMDIFYDSLPTKSKFRRHYHHLLLDLYKIIWQEAERRRLSVRQGVPRATATPEIGTGAVWTRDRNDPNKSSAWRRALRGMPFFRPDSLADERQGTEQLSYIPGPDGDVVKTTLPLHAAAHLFLKYGHILLFDEIQLVDVASAGLLRRTLEAYWRLGGVVVGTSNRIPKDLYASNVQRSQITQFLEILQERCPNYEMRRNRDFRRQPFFREEWLKRNQESSDEQPSPTSSAAEVPGVSSYFLRAEEDKFQALVDDVVAGRQASPSTVNVYGRRLNVPAAIPSSVEAGLPSVCQFTFTELCDSPLGPADYLTLASTYHTFVVTGVPQMTLMQKNQARRMITFLDAVYEAGCRLIVLADAGPDDLFFPDAETAARHAARGPEAGPGDVNPQLLFQTNTGYKSTEPDDVVDMSTKGARSPFLTPPSGQLYPEEERLARQKAGQRIDFSQDEFMTESFMMAETLSEAMQDTDEGFRPNISAYSETRPSRSGVADEQQSKNDKVEFKHLSIFSGEDERFAYQRAVSRLFEMSHPQWMQRKGWRPFLANEMESWAGTTAASASKSAATEFTDRSPAAARFVDPSGDFAEEASYEKSSFPAQHPSHSNLEREMQEYTDKQHRQQEKGVGIAGEPDFSGGPIGKSRDRNRGPPVLSEAHVWGVREDWGKKAGAWGKGSAVFGDSTATPSTPESVPSRPRPQSAAPVGVKRRKFSTSARSRARQQTAPNFYRTLNVERTASQAQIKSQFYKLSKELHPDINPSEDAKKRFQEVSEAYAMLGSAANRRSYDRQLSTSGGGYSGYGDNVGRGFGPAHDFSENSERRARATYAWEYQRRRRPANPGSTSKANSSSTTHGRQTHSSIFNESASGGSSSSSAFERLAAQQRAREERNRARQAGSTSAQQADDLYQADVSNPMVRFAQVLLMLGIVFKAGTYFH